MAHDGHPHHHHPHSAQIGHNGHHAARQWQTPHLPGGPEAPDAPPEADLDLVETAFLDAFPRSSDPTSFLRLSGVPFVGRTVDGRILNLLRVESHQTTDVGTVTPHLGGEGFRYDPLPAKLASRRQTLAFVYADGARPVRLSLAEAKDLIDLTPRR